MKTAPAIATTSRIRRAATFGSGRRWWARLRLVLGLWLVAYILFLANIIAFRRPVRFDWTAEGLSTISQATRERLALVQEDILVVIPTFMQSGNNDHIAFREVLERARALLLEYCALQPRIKIAAEVNVFSQPDRWTQVKTQYDIDDSQLNRFIFCLGKSIDKRQSVTPQDLAVFGKPKDAAIAVPQILAFRGEKAITDAIVRLIERRERPVYFLQGHGELSLHPEGGRDVGPAGIAALLHELGTAGMSPRELSLVSAREVPADCALLVIAGAQQDYDKAELEALERYLQGGGKLLATLGPRRTNLDGLLSRWGIRPVAGKVNGSMVLPGTKIATSVIPVRSFHKGHAVTRVFSTVPRFEMRLVAPCPLESGALEKNLDATALLAVSSKEGESFYLVPDRRDEALPKASDFDLAVAVEQRAPERPPPGFQRLETRILVVGGSSFLLDQYFMTGSHRDFLMNGIAWLTGEEERATVGGQAWAERMLKSSPGVQTFLFWVPIFLLPGVFLCMGAFVYYLRRA